MKKRLRTIICTVLLAPLLFGCRTQPAEQLDQTRTEKLISLSNEFTSFLSKGNTEAALAMMDDTMKAAMEGNLQGVWMQLVTTQGKYIETGSSIGENVEGYDAIEMTLIFENGTIIQRTVFDSENRVAGLWFQPGEIKSISTADPISDDIEEVGVTIDAGDGYPLDGVLTLPKSGNAMAAVVLVHGSGPSDMDVTIGANAPFRDLANALSEKGIAVLKYDKRTYTYGVEMSTSPDFDKLTIDEEMVYDAVAAVNLLKSWEGIDENKVYLLGHSMSGCLLSYINSMGADCAGYIIMAGTIRNLWELSAEQNLLIAEEMEQGGDHEMAEEIRLLVEQEIQKGQELHNMSDEEALDEDNMVFGMSPWYLRKFEQIDAVALHIDDGKPILVLQGEKDRQVTMMDFQLWKDALADHPDATFKSYPELNHLFGEYIGDEVPFSMLVSVEYAQKTPVPDTLINDIAEWVFSNSK